MTKITKKKTDELTSFDFAAFQAEAVEKLKQGEPLLGSEGIVTPLIKQIMEASLEGELAAHLEECEASGIANRRNGKNCRSLDLI